MPIHKNKHLTAEEEEDEEEKDGFHLASASASASSRSYCENLGGVASVVCY